MIYEHNLQAPNKSNDKKVSNTSQNQDLNCSEVQKFDDPKRKEVESAISTSFIALPASLSTDKQGIYVSNNTTNASVGQEENKKYFIFFKGFLIMYLNKNSQSLQALAQADLIRFKILQISRIIL